MPGPDRFRRNVQLVRRRVVEEVEVGSTWVEARLDHLVPGLLGVLVNPVARRLYHWIGREEVKRRALAQLDILVIAGRELQHHPLDEVVDRHADEALQTEEIHARGRRDHPRFDQVEETLRDLFRERVRVVGRLLNEGEGGDYDALVASVFDRDEVEAVLDRQFRAGEGLLELVREEPDILRAPRAFRHVLLELVEASFTWYRERVRDQLDDIFGARPAASP